MTLTNKYAGILYVGQYERNLAVAQCGTMARIAGQMNLAIDDSSIIVLRDAYSSDNNNVGQFWLQNRTSLAVLKLGFMPRPIALLTRPSPISAEGANEKMGTSVIPGSTFGVLLAKDIEWSSVNVGLYYKDAKPEFDAGVKINVYGLMDVKVGGFTSLESSGIAMGLEAPIMKYIVYLSSTNSSTNLREPAEIASIFLELNLEKFGSPYISVSENLPELSRDTSISMQEEKWTGEIGWQKTYKLSNPYSNSNMSGLLGIAYDLQSHTAKMYIQMYID
jgi:hypothetical protein